jgi:hypothetical protein
MTQVVVLDNEAVQALRSPAHPKHRRALALVQVTSRRRGRGARVRLVVPTAVRAEAGWDRTDPRAAFLNLLGARDAVLDRPSADLAARLVTRYRVSVADAHIGAVLHELAASDRPVVLTSDPRDIASVAAGVQVTVVAL